MKLKKYIEELNKLTIAKPECLEFEVVTSKDDEGNGFDRVFYTPSTGSFRDGEWDGEADREEHNAVCLN